MTITKEEKDYFLEGIGLVFKQTTKITLCKTYVTDAADSVDLISKLTEKLGRNFVAAASSEGVITPKSIRDLIRTDVTITQKYVGVDSKVVLKSEESLNLNEKITEINAVIGNSSLSVFSDPRVTPALLELYANMKDIFDMLSIDRDPDGEIISKTDNIINLFGSTSYKISGEPRTLTGCSYNFKTESYSLGEFITKTRTTTLGLEKSKLECINWSVLNINHYFTTTGDVEGCSYLGYIPKGQAYEECVAALGISID